MPASAPSVDFRKPVSCPATDRFDLLCQGLMYELGIPYAHISIVFEVHAECVLLRYKRSRSLPDSLAKEYNVHETEIRDGNVSSLREFL